MYFYRFKHGFLVCIIVSFLSFTHLDFFASLFSHSLSIGSSPPGFHRNLPNVTVGSGNGCTIGNKVCPGGGSMARMSSFIRPSANVCRLGKNGTVLRSHKFAFDERAARRARHLRIVSENTLKKMMAKKTMKKMVQAVTRSSDEHKQLEIQKFISDIQYSPNRTKLPAPPEIYSPSYDALVYLKGIPYNANEQDVLDWLKNYEVLTVVFIKNENGFFTGDAYVRFMNLQVRDRVAKEMANRAIGGRYIQVFRVNENAYLEYYHSGCRKQPKDRNHVDPSVLVVTNKDYHNLLNEPSPDLGASPGVSFFNNVSSDVDVADLNTGTRLVATVTEVYRNGVVLDCNIFETRNGLREKVFCILKKNRIAKNIGLQGQQHEWLKTKQLILYPGIRLNLYVEKIRDTTARNTFDRDMWTEHFDQSLLDTYLNEEEVAPFPHSGSSTEGSQEHSVESRDIKAAQESDAESLCPKAKNAGAARKRKLVYLTMDSSVSEDKVLWWEKKILRQVVGRHRTRSLEDVVIREDLRHTSDVDKVFSGKVKVKEVHQGNTIVHGNKPSQIVLGNTEIFPAKESEFGRISVGNRPKTVEDSGLESVKESAELPDDVPLGTLLRRSSDPEPKRGSNLFVFNKEITSHESPENVEFVDANFKKLTDRFFKNTTTRDKDIHFHDFENPPEPDLGEASEEVGLDYFKLGSEEDGRKYLEEFPRLTLFDAAIKVPPNGLILRESEVATLSHDQIKRILQLLEKETRETYEDNRAYLVEVIKTEGLPTDLLPQTLIQKGLYKVKQSKEYMKHIVKITKDLTGRKFSKEDLEAASSEELEMLVEEALYKFLNWNPPFDIKKQFVTTYHHLLNENVQLPTIGDVVPKPGFMSESDGPEKVTDSGPQDVLVDPGDENAQRIEKMWNDMKWLIVIFIYGEQSDLKDIVKQLEKDTVFSKDPNLRHTPMEMESLLIQSKSD